MPELTPSVIKWWLKLRSSDSRSLNCLTILASPSFHKSQTLPNCGSKLKRGRKVSNLLPWGMLNKHHSKSNLHRLVRSCCFPGVCLQSEPTNNQDEDLGWLIYWLEESRCHSISWRKLLFPWGGKSLVVLLLQDRLQKFMNCELLDVHIGFRNGRGFRKRFLKGSGFRKDRSNCQHPLDDQKRKRIPEKHLLLLCFLC